MPLSVASAFVRLGRDPWAEAGRLAQMPRDAATEALAAVIDSISPPRVSPSDAPGLAARVMLHLPSAEESPPATEPALRAGCRLNCKAGPTSWPYCFA